MKRASEIDDTRFTWPILFLRESTTSSGGVSAGTSNDSLGVSLDTLAASLVYAFEIPGRPGRKETAARVACRHSSARA